jgi:hypothetical protein
VSTTGTCPAKLSAILPPLNPLPSREKWGSIEEIPNLRNQIPHKIQKSKVKNQNDKAKMQKF